MKMFIQTLTVFMLSMLSINAYAKDNGIITFSGEIVDSSCALSYNEEQNKYGCSNDINNEIYNNQKNTKKEEKKYVNYDNIKKISDFPKKDGEVKNFVIDGNNVKITKVDNVKYNKLYKVEIMIY